MIIGSYVILFASLLSIKIAGLELFGVLQLAYFTLADHEILNLYLSPFLAFSGFNIQANTERLNYLQ